MNPIGENMTNHILEVGNVGNDELVLGNRRNYEMKYLNENDLQDILNLQKYIVNNLPDPELYQPASVDLLRERLTKEKFVIGLSTDEDLIAFGIIHMPGYEEDNLGRDIGMDDDLLNNVAHIQFIVVHPHYRGNSFQKKLANSLLSVINDMNYTHVLGTISPKNYFSLRNMLDLGFVIREIKPKYGGKLRYIIYKNVNITHPNWQDVVKIANLDIDGQRELLKEGFVGFDISNEGKGFMVHYGRI